MRKTGPLTKSSFSTHFVICNCGDSATIYGLETASNSAFYFSGYSHHDRLTEACVPFGALMSHK